jgi:hypothetical protein
VNATKNFEARTHAAAVTASINGTPRTVLSQLGAISGSLPVVFIDPSSQAHSVRAYLNEQENFDEYLAQFEAKIITGDELAIYAAVLGRNFASLTVRELESPDDPDGVIPIFSVKLSAGLNYDSRSMGFGELCACFVIWKLRRCDKGSIVFIDEPDSHLSAHARRSLTDCLAVTAAERELWILFSSHSVEPVEKLREEELILLRRPEHAPEPVAVAQHKRDAIVGLGLSLSKRFLILTEDVDAADLTQIALARWQPQLAKACEIKAAIRGAEELGSLANLFPIDTNVCRLLVVLDGDKRASIGQNAQIRFLPGNEDPVQRVQAWCTQNVEVLAKQLGVDSAALRLAVQVASAVDYHDFFSTVASELQQSGMTTGVIRRAVFASWGTQPEVAPELQAFAEEVRSAVAAAPFFN